MCWDKKPSADEMAKWFSQVKLHDELDHANYIGGIVVIENKQLKQWNPYPLAGVRIAYFWDWVDSHGYAAHIDTTAPEILDFPFTKGQGDDPFTNAKTLLVSAHVKVLEGERVVREATAQKQVTLNMKVGGTWDGQLKRKVNQSTIPDFTSVMKAETGAVARALANMGMLALPGSGVASAEDIFEYMRDAEETMEGTTNVDQQQQPVSRRADNPKSASGT